MSKITVTSRGFTPCHVCAVPGSVITWRLSPSVSSALEYDVQSRGVISILKPSLSLNVQVDDDFGDEDEDEEDDDNNDEEENNMMVPTNTVDFQALRAIGPHFTQVGGKGPHLNDPNDSTNKNNNNIRQRRRRRQDREADFFRSPVLSLSVSELSFDSQALQLGRDEEFMWTVPDADEIRNVLSASGAPASAVASLVRGETSIGFKYSSSLWTDLSGVIEISLGLHTKLDSSYQTRYYEEQKKNDLATTPTRTRNANVGAMASVTAQPQSSVLTPERTVGSVGTYDQQHLQHQSLLSNSSNSLSSPQRRLEAVSPARHRQKAESGGGGGGGGRGNINKNDDDNDDDDDDNNDDSEFEKMDDNDVDSSSLSTSKHLTTSNSSNRNSASSSLLKTKTRKKPTTINSNTGGDAQDGVLHRRALLPTMTDDGSTSPILTTKRTAVSSTIKEEEEDISLLGGNDIARQYSSFTSSSPSLISSPAPPRFTSAITYTTTTEIDDALEYRSLRGSYISVDDKYGDNDNRSEISESVTANERGGGNGNDGERRVGGGGRGDTYSSDQLPMTYASIRQSVERRFSGKRSTHDYMAKLNVLKARWGVSAEAGALAGRSSSGGSFNDSVGMSVGGGGGEGRGRGGSVVSAATDSIDSGSIISDLTRPSAATAPTTLFRQGGQPSSSSPSSSSSSSLSSSLHHHTSVAQSSSSSSSLPSSSSSAAAIIYLVSDAHTSPAIGIRIHAGQAVEWRALSFLELSPLLSSLTPTTLARMGGHAIVDSLKKIATRAEEIEDVSTYSIEITKRKSSSSSSSSATDPHEWSSTVELTVCLHSLKDRPISSTSNSVGSVVSVFDPSRGGIGCSSCKWHSGIVFEERGLYDWNWTIYPYVRGTIVVLDRPAAASSSLLSSSSSSPSSTSTRPQTIFPISIPPPPFPLLSASSASQPPLRQSHLTPSKVASAQQQQGRMISTSSSSPILNEEDEKVDRDEEKRYSQPSILTSPSSSSSVASNSKRRRNKKKKGGETIASRLVDVSSMSLLNESIEVKTAISSFSSLIAQEQIVKESGEATPMMMKKKEEDELMKKRGDEVTRETVTSLALTNTSPIISQARYKGPVVPWASIAPDVDPSSFNAWGKFVFASMRGAGAAGEHFKTQI